ncbi:hypothetical protein MAR_038550 [Mya arenaria]|uniref:Peptidase M12B domain-containing protein n=1 Tax=Mya arenaria TaxID=6604 RepID=A0ABY7G0J9_MYAAR|nr:hypothetical protein MAR_038550 [Mya arenaria]
MRAEEATCSTPSLARTGSCGPYFRRPASRFYDRNLGDNNAAQNEAEMYMNVFYSSVKEASGGSLDLYVFPSDIVYPQAGTNFAWSGDYVTGDVIDTEGNFNNALYAYVNSGFTSEDFDHAMAITGDTAYRYSINEFASYNVAPVAAHELGHALGSQHDSTGNNCPSSRNVMSPYLGTPSGSSVDNFYKFSTCSAGYFIAHLDQYPSCSVNTGGLTDAQFEKAFCSGLLGQRDSSLDLQCKRRTGNRDSTACSQICYKGRCVSEFDICPTGETPSTPTTPTTTTTTPAPTTTAPAPCSCCGKRGRKKKKCCRRGRRRYREDCYCCNGRSPPA